MKTIRLAMVGITLLALLVPLPGALAQGIGGPYTVGVQVQNMSADTDANVQLNFYNQDGTQPPSSGVSVVISKTRSMTFFPLNSVPSGFNGSLVISSDQQVAAIANVVTTDYNLQAAYSSFSGGATTVNLPLVVKNNYGNDTWFSVQNTDSTPATVYVTYKGTSNNGGTISSVTCTEQKTVQPNASQTLDQSTNACMGTASPVSFAGAATITSTNKIVATVMQIRRSGTKTLMAYNGFTTSSTQLVMPLISSNWYRSGTGIQIQNAGASATTVTLQYSPSAGFPGTTCTEAKAIPAGESRTFAYPQLPTGCGTTSPGGSAVTDLVNGAFVGSAKVLTNSANMPLVSIVNQVNRAGANASSYDGVNPATATAHVSLPAISDRNYGNFSGFSIANVGTQPTNISCTFANSARTVSASSVAPGAALTDVQLNQLADKYVGAATCTATGGDALIAGVVNLAKQGAPSTSDALSTYDGFNY